ncbi:hypothetical protein ACFVDI_24675 [Nocardioides sp. NPDC057767]|uniref:hypothetical protein n=1 Tax=unclassified Nocardioides TaxID=2615069 RepID=UPI003671B5CB
MLYDDLVAEFAWSPEQMSAPFDLKAADEVIRKRIESRRRSPSPQATVRQAPRQRQNAVAPEKA